MRYRRWPTITETLGHMKATGYIGSSQGRCSGGSETVKHYSIDCPTQSYGAFYGTNGL